MFHPLWLHFPGFIGIPCTLQQCTASSVPTHGQFHHKSFTAFELKDYLQVFHLSYASAGQFEKHYLRNVFILTWALCLTWLMQNTVLQVNYHEAFGKKDFFFRVDTRLSFFSCVDNGCSSLHSAAKWATQKYWFLPQGRLYYYQQNAQSERKWSKSHRPPSSLGTWVWNKCRSLCLGVWSF